MLKARQLEMKLSSLYKAGKIVGGVYLGKGQEAVSGSLGASLIQGRDIFAPLIRDQAGRTAFGEDVMDCARTYLGSKLGPMRGRDGNIHRGRPKEGMLAMISHLGAQVPMVAGSLLSRRLKGELKGTVEAVFKELLGDDVKLRFRPHYFSYTEPSLEIDFTNSLVKKLGKDWLEIAGCGMVHPQVFENVGYDPEVWTGWAFGFGIERIAMLRYGITDIRLFYENDARFLRQF